MSIEGIFTLVKECLENKINAREFFCDDSLSRKQNMANAKKAAADVNHITGDVNFLAIALKGKKNVLTIHDFGHYENLKKKSLLRFLGYKLFWFQLPLKNVSIVTVVSNFTKEKLIRYLHFPENRIRVIYNPVKPIFKYAPKEKINSSPRILQIGTGPHKNLKNLVAAATGTNWHLDIIAHLNEADLSMLNAANVSFTIYNGLTDEEIYAKYKECDLLFFASFHEGFGMPIIEAQSIGRPVITSNFGAMKEVAKESAILVDPNNPDEIKSAILRLTGDREFYNNVVAKGLTNVIPFQHDFIAEQYLKVYKELQN